MPSLYIDLEKGRLRSEVLVLNGAVVSAGRETGVPVPVNAALTEILIGIAGGEIDRNEFRGRPECLLAAVAAQEREGRAAYNVMRDG